LGKNKSDELFFNNFYKLIEKNLSDPNLNMQFLAKKLNISQSSMYKKVKDITDISPNDFIRITRLKKGAALISEGVLSIKEITYLIGYSSPTYFSTCFQRQFGVTPTEYAKSLKESSIKQVNDTNNEPQE
jgi:AraC-type DNA-binding domain-containing proteins